MREKTTYKIKSGENYKGFSEKSATLLKSSSKTEPKVIKAEPAGC